VDLWRWRHGEYGEPDPYLLSAGSFGVLLAVTGPGGEATKSKSGYITVNASPGTPTATFSADVVSGTSPLAVTFTAVPSGTVEHWLWRFGDGDMAFTGPVVDHTYVTSGTFDVSLTVSSQIAEIPSISLDIYMIMYVITIQNINIKRTREVQ